MKTSFSIACVIAITVALTTTSDAQRPPRGGGGDQPGPPPGARVGGNQEMQFRGGQNANADNANQFGANQNNAGQNNGRNMPSIAQLAQMMIANFDADGSGGLAAGELQNALTALRQMMQNQNQGQMQAGAQDVAANQQNNFQQRGFGQANQAAVDDAQALPPRRPPGGGANNALGVGRGR